MGNLEDILMVYRKTKLIKVFIIAHTFIKTINQIFFNIASYSHWSHFFYIH